MKFQNVQKEYEEILQQLSNPGLISDWEKGDELTKRKNYLEKIIEKEKAIKDLENKIEENRAILKSQEDQEFVSLAETEIVQLTEKKKMLEEELKKLLSGEGEKNVPKAVVAEASPHLPERSEGREMNKVQRTPPRPASPGSAIVEIRAGAGGEEAALFVADLFKMYSKYAAFQNWKVKVLDLRPTSLNGLKEIIFEIIGEEVFSKMKKEAGVHRVQRIPTTEKSGRIHTSTASLAVLLKPQKGKITINPHDLKVDTYKASGHGGQNVNKRMTAVRITHLPTGLVVTSQAERNLQQNRENALGILEAKLLEKKGSEEMTKIGRERRSQIGKAQRAEKIRTYNFPQNRITDHRIKKSFHNLEEIMEGKLEPIIQALQKSVSVAAE